MMYNENQKLQFINSLNEDEKGKESYKILFKKLYNKAESDFDKDISEMNYDELKISIASLGSRDIKSIAWNISRLKQYVDWCIINGKTNILENHLALISASEIDNSYVFEREMLKSPEHLADVLDVVYPPVEELHFMNMYRIYFWLLYEGFTNEEAVILRRDEVNLEDNIIKTSNKTITPSPIFKYLLQITVPSNQLMKRTKKEKLFFDLCDSPYLLRLLKETNVLRAKQFGAKITTFNKKYKEETGQYIKLSPIRVYESGLFYRWYQLEKENISISFSEYVEMDIENKEYALKKEYVATQKAKDIELAYNMWKKAFGY
jgi:hypothetical protein